MKIPLPLVTVVASLCPLVAAATVSATKEQILCNSSHIVLAVVQRAELEPEACFDQPSVNCMCRGELTVRVTALVGIKRSVSTYPEDVGIYPGKEVRLVWQQVLQQQLRTFISPRSCDSIRQQVLGHEYLFSVGTYYGQWADGTMHVSKPPYPTSMWQLDDAAWVNKLLATETQDRCPSSVRQESTGATSQSAG